MGSAPFDLCDLLLTRQDMDIGIRGFTTFQRRNHETGELRFGVSKSLCRSEGGCDFSGVSDEILSSVHFWTLQCISNEVRVFGLFDAAELA
jgi:hypothetical protein